MIRIRIIQVPPEPSIDGIRFEDYQVGHQYEVGNSVGALMLAEGWAEPLPLDEPAAASSFGEPILLEPKTTHRQSTPPNLIRESYPTILQDVFVDWAAEQASRKPRKPSPAR